MGTPSRNTSLKASSVRITVTVNEPFGWLGRAIHMLTVRRKVEEIFAYRQEKVRALFGAGDK